MSETWGDPQKTMIDDMLLQNWSTLHSHSLYLKFEHSTKAAWGKPVEGDGTGERTG
jgi:hypothetical protein